MYSGADRDAIYWRACETGGVLVRLIIGFGSVLALAACGGEDEELRSEMLDEPSVVFDVVPPDVNTGWPEVPTDTEDTEDTNDTVDTLDTDTIDTDIPTDTDGPVDTDAPPTP